MSNNAQNIQQQQHILIRYMGCSDVIHHILYVYYKRKKEFE